MTRYKNILAAGLLTIFLSGCAQSESSKELTATDHDCPVINGIDDLLDKPLPRVIILGELHGMEGPPAFAQALVCHSLVRGNATALGFEMSDDENGTIETYLTSNGDAAAKEELFKLSMWTGSFTDGRSSDAMLDLLDFARVQVKRSGNNFTPFLFQETDADWTKYQSDPKAVLQTNEKGMAQNILDIASSGAVDKTIVLVGTLHAKRAKNPFGESDYDFMATHMLPPDTISLTNLYGSGSSWNCRGSLNGTNVCGESETQGNVDAESELAKTGEYAVIIPKSPKTPPSGYDGVFYVGPAKASPPANLDGRAADQ